MTEKYARPDAEVTRSIAAHALEAVRERRKQHEAAAKGARDLPARKETEPRENGAPYSLRYLMMDSGAERDRTRPASALWAPFASLTRPGFSLPCYGGHPRTPVVDGPDPVQAPAAKKPQGLAAASDL